MKTRYQQVWSGQWETLPRDWDLACCDCGMVHRIRIRVRRGHPEIQFTNENRKTAAVRRQMKVRKEGLYRAKNH